MRNSLLKIMVPFMIVFGSLGCANPGIVKISPDTYMIFREDHAGIFGSLAKMKADVIRDANAFAELQGKIAIPISMKEKPIGLRPADWATFEYQFRVISKDEEVLFIRTGQAESNILKKSGASNEKLSEIQKKEGVNKTPINLFDWNDDGKKDIIFGSKSGHVFVSLNRGTNQEPVFDTAFRVPNVIVEGDSDPCIVDWNNDGKKDLLVGQGSGEVFKFINIGTNQQPLFTDEQKLNNGDLDVGSYSSPAMIDWNGDGRNDLVVGNQKGDVYVFLNMGYEQFLSDKIKTELSSDGLKTDIKVPKKATPYIADWNNDGKFDVVSGSSDGRVYIFINEGDSKNPKFGKPQAVHVNNKELKLPNSTSVIALNWDDDGNIDLLVSHNAVIESDVRTGLENIIPTGIYLLLNTGTKEKPEFKELKQIKGIFRDDTVL